MQSRDQPCKVHNDHNRNNNIICLKPPRLPKAFRLFDGIRTAFDLFRPGIIQYGDYKRIGSRRQVRINDRPKFTLPDNILFVLKSFQIITNVWIFFGVIHKNRCDLNLIRRLSDRCRFAFTDIIFGSIYRNVIEPHTINGFIDGLGRAGATLTVALYVYAKEQGEFEVAFAIAAILMILALLVNLAAKFTGLYFKKKVE